MSLRNKNDTTERVITFVNLFHITRTWFIQSGLPKSLWLYAFSTAAYVVNRRPCYALEKYEAFYGFKPDISNLRSWGCRCFVLNNKQHLRKLENRSFQGRFIGYSKAYPIYLPGSNAIVESADVTFDVERFSIDTDVPDQSEVSPDEYNYDDWDSDVDEPDIRPPLPVSLAPDTPTTTLL
jgi:hypothetical protein